MPNLPMPDRPHLENFRRQARDLQRGVRAGDPASTARAELHRGSRQPEAQSAFPLSAAQLVIAREYGFASWTSLRRFVTAVDEHGWDTSLSSAATGDPAQEFCRLACLTYGDEDGPARWAQARQLLVEHPRLTATDIWAAATAARPDDVGRLLAEQPSRVSERDGPLQWRPLFYLAYSRFDPAVPAEAVLTVARQLLDAGADPNDGYLFDALPSPFTVLTGVFGNGELGPQRQPRHPHWQALGRLLLDAGAEPNDAQTLYNRMFEADNSHLELLFEYGLGRGDGGPWKRRIEALDTPAQLLGTQLRWAVEHHQFARVRLLVEHGVDVRSRFEHQGPAWSPGDGRTPLELALLNGDTEITDYLLSHGAVHPGPDPVRDLIAAAFRADLPAVERLRSEHPDAVMAARRDRPGLIVWAATQAPLETVSLLTALGFDVNAYGRGDAPVEQPWETALHHSAAEGNAELTGRLLELGADPNLRDQRFDATPLDWARHFDRAATVALLEPVTAPVPGDE